MLSRLRNHLSDQPRQGAMLILVAVMLVILLVMTAFSIDVAYMQLIRTELRTATDAAARAASEALVRTQSPAEARAAARRAASLNSVGGDPLLLADSDIIIGRAVQNRRGTFAFDANGNIKNAVRVLGRRTDDSPSGAVPLFMGAVLGRDTFEPQMASTSTGIVRDIALVLDRSGSMSGQKIADLKTGVSDFLSVLEATSSDERVSLTSYSTTGTKDINMTSNLDSIRTRVNGFPAAGFTAIGQGMTIGSDSLVNDARSRDFAEKTMVLLTDGIENRGPFVNEVLDIPVDRGQTIHTITFGSGADQTLMRDVARATGGVHIHADDGSDLIEAFREIARTLAVVLID